MRIYTSRIDGRLDSAAPAMVQCVSDTAFGTDRFYGRMLTIFRLIQVSVK